MLMPLCTIHGVEDGGPVMSGDWEHEEGKVHMARHDSHQIGNMGVAMVWGLAKWYERGARCMVGRRPRKCGSGD